MTRFIWAFLFVAGAFFGSFTAFSQTRPAPQAVALPSPFSYADVADLVTKAPLVVDARIRKATVLPPERAMGIASDKARIYVEADVISLIRGNTPLAARIAWLVDLPRDAKGKAPKLNKQRVLAFARPAGTGEIALIAPDAQLGWDVATDTLARRIISETLRVDAPARITGIASGFHQRGSLPGESESQFFLETERGDPVTLTVLRLPGSPPSWAVAFGEIVDGTAMVPPRDTLGWYRLACGLPRSLPADRISANEDERTAAIADYRFIIAQLGECRRTRTAPAQR